MCPVPAIDSVFADPGLARVPAKRLRSVANRSIHPASWTVRGIQACTTAITGADVNSWARLSADSPSACQMSRARLLLAHSRRTGGLRWENSTRLRSTPKSGRSCRRHGETDQPRSGFWRVSAAWTVEGVQRVCGVGSCNSDGHSVIPAGSGPARGPRPRLGFLASKPLVHYVVGGHNRQTRARRLPSVRVARDERVRDSEPLAECSLAQARRGARMSCADLVVRNAADDHKGDGAASFVFTQRG